MDIRTMKYFLAIVREGTISGAAQTLHVAQPSLSRQMKDLEDELGVSLFIRGNRKIELTEEGMVLRRRAEEMVRLLQMTEDEISQIKNQVSGTVRIGAGESSTFHILSKTASELVQIHPDIRFEITSGDTHDLIDQLNNGLIDFALIFTEPDHSLYQSMTLGEDCFCLLMPKDCELAKHEVIHINELKELPLIVSRAQEPSLSGAERFAGLHIVGTYNLVYNASLMVEDGVGYALCFDNLINTSKDSPLCSRPIVPRMKSEGKLIWKKYQVFSPAVQLFINRLRKSHE